MKEQLVNIIINASMYCAWAIFLIRKRGICINTYPVILWAISSVASIYYFMSEYRYHTFINEITLIPFVYLFILVWISFRPLVNFDSQKIRRITINNTFYKIVSWCVIALSLSVFLQNCLYFANNMLSGQAFLDAYTSKMEGEQIEIFTGFSNFLMRYCKFFKGIIPIFFILSFTSFVKANMFLRIGLFLSLMNLFVNYMNTSSRFALLTDFFLLTFLYVLLYRYFHPKIKRLANIIGVSMAGGLIIGVLVITFQRFGDDSGYSKSLDYNLSLYLGESFLNFNGDMWNMQNYADGQNCMAYFIDKFNGKALPGRDYLALERVVNRRMNVFYTFIGDYYTDLGRIGTVVAVLLLTSLFSKIVRAKRSMSIGIIILFSTYVKVLLVGFTYWTYLNYSMEFVVNIVIALLFILTNNYDFNRNGDVQRRKIYS